jgi:acyl-CoA synthetase (AMP-forming)/AMP-acid ligase II
MAEFTFAPLTPASFLDRSAAVFADRTAIMDGERTFSYRDLSDRCGRLTGAMAALGIGHEDRVAALCANSHVMLELHHAVPMLGAALVPVNVRLSAMEMAEILDHSGASILVATHEFAYLQATAMAYHARLGPGVKYLWTLPMFHCNGWCFTWAVTAAGAPNIIARPLRVLDDNGSDVPPDGETIGEIAVSGNDVMLGYYRDDEATREVTRSGCFLTGDLAVRHPDGYVEIRDRSKDIIVSGGENIASVEVERVLDSHPAVVESAVVGVPDERWGEVPVAFVMLRNSEDADAGALADYARERLARYKVPKRIEFGELPKTSTGKIQKNVLRDMARQRHGDS